MTGEPALGVTVVGGVAGVLVLGALGAGPQQEGGGGKREERLAHRRETPANGCKWTVDERSQA